MLRRVSAIRFEDILAAVEAVLDDPLAYGDNLTGFELRNASTVVNVMDAIRSGRGC